MKPSVLVYCFSCGLRFVQISFHNMRPFDPNFSCLIRSQNFRTSNFNYLQNNPSKWSLIVAIPVLTYDIKLDSVGQVLRRKVIAS